MMEQIHTLQSNSLGTAVRLALPSDGELHAPTMNFMEFCGLSFKRANPRRYTGSVPSVPGVVTLFQRATDIPAKVDEGSADIGIVGLDRYMEFKRDQGETSILMQDLDFGKCELVLAVPDLWIDITSMNDLSNLSTEFKNAGKELRIATKFPRLTEKFLSSNNIHHFTIVLSSGGLEAAPTMGYADLIADLSASGSTLRENGLKTLDDGGILASQACLIGNLRLLGLEPSKLFPVKQILEKIEGYLRAQEYSTVTANVPGNSPADVASQMLSQPHLLGIQGPTIAPVFSHSQEEWCAVTILVKSSQIPEVVESFRNLNGNGIAVSRHQYLFQRESSSYQSLIDNIKDWKIA